MTTNIEVRYRVGFHDFYSLREKEMATLTHTHINVNEYHLDNAWLSIIQENGERHFYPAYSIVKFIVKSGSVA